MTRLLRRIGKALTLTFDIMRIQSAHLTWDKYPSEWVISLTFSVSVKSLAGHRIYFTCFDSTQKSKWLFLALSKCFYGAYREQKAFRVRYYSEQKDVKTRLFEGINHGGSLDIYMVDEEVRKSVIEAQ
jgi:hypothetical protein